MKLAALTPRTITFNHEHVQHIAAKPRLHVAPAPVCEYREARGPRLTPRELEVLALLCEGLPNKLISRRLGISTGTVKIHVGKILAQLEVSSRLQAVVAAHRLGLVGESADGVESEGAADAQESAAQPFSRSSLEIRPLRAA
jgi:DNA-binding NarL/FixJ family response regulator